MIELLVLLSGTMGYFVGKLPEKDITIRTPSYMGVDARLSVVPEQSKAVLRSL